MKQDGVSIIELLLVITLISIIGATSAPVFSNFLSRNYLENKSNETISTLRTAQVNSMSGKEDSTWGVYIDSNTIALFKGGSYAGRDQAFDQDYSVPAIISISGLTEVVFEKTTGDTSDTGIITISNNLNENNILTINQAGTVDVN